MIPLGVPDATRRLVDVVREALTCEVRRPLPDALPPIPLLRPGGFGTSRYLLDDPRGAEAADLVRDLFETWDERLAYVAEVCGEAARGRAVGWHAAVAVQLVCAWLRPRDVLGTLMLPGPSRLDWWATEPGTEAGRVIVEAVAAARVLVRDPGWMQPLRDEARRWLMDDLTACLALLVEFEEGVP